MQAQHASCTCQSEEKNIRVHDVDIIFLLQVKTTLSETSSTSIFNKFSHISLTHACTVSRHILKHFQVVF